MRPLRHLLPVLALAFTVLARPSAAQSEYVTGGMLDLIWAAGFSLPGNMPASNLAPLSLDPGHPAYDNPSGDHTVAVATTTCPPPNCGAVVLSATDPGAMNDYAWQGWMFTGPSDSTSRRGLIVRSDPGASFSSGYVLVVEPSLLQVRFRRLVGPGPVVTLGDWFLATPLTPSTWIPLKIVAVGSAFRCFVNGVELTTTPIIDANYSSGWVGVYNFNTKSATQQFNSAYYDDLMLLDQVTHTAKPTWGQLKVRYR